MSSRAALRSPQVLLPLILVILLAISCGPASGRPSSDASKHQHHHDHNHEHHHAHHEQNHRAGEEMTRKAPEETPEDSAEVVPRASPPAPATTPKKTAEDLGESDEDEDDEVAINDADYYFGDDADLLTAAAGAVDAHLRAEEEAERRKEAAATVTASSPAIDDAASGGRAGEATAPGEEEMGNGTASSSAGRAAGEEDEDQINGPAQQIETRERHKEIRLNTIKNTILTLLGREPGLVTANRSIPLTATTQQHFAEVYERMRHTPQWPPSDLYTEKVQSFYPSCEVPRNTDEEAWHGPNVMNLLFNLSLPAATDGSTITIVAAKLRLFKLSQANLTSGATNDGCPPSSITTSTSTQASSAADTEPSDAVAAEVLPVADEPIVGPPASPLLTHNPVPGLMHLPASALQQDDHRIRVSVYWYTRALKKHRAVKRKLLDSQMVSISSPKEWVAFDVRFAARVWRELGKNFGLVVEVEDEDGALLPAERYFAAMNCSKEASTTRPFPGFLFDAAREAGSVGAGSGGAAGNGLGNEPGSGNMGAGMGGGSRALSLDTNLFPLMDLCTIQYPEGEEPLHLLPSLSSPSAFSFSFGRRSPMPPPPAPSVMMVACGGARGGGVGQQRQVVPAPIHPIVGGGVVVAPGGGRHRRPEDKTAKSPEEGRAGRGGGRRKGQERDDDNDATATNQLNQRRDGGEGTLEGPLVDSPSAIQVTKIRHPRRHLEGGHTHRTREGRRLAVERGDAGGREGEDEKAEEEDEEVREEERVSWQDSEGRQHVKRKVVVHKTIVSHREGAGHEEGEEVDRNEEGRSIAMVDHRGR
ncbi:uncharacterized protein LOC124157780 isoform X2 [Ischnura elegans]|uniref:uncharacterized protein LOC124157780 isoform X2 n=1 Tax=Ischnura elegans TaxID=197161 RepID=UPI001ED8BF32|nr:uncharacterized protein LOC124157780 isoform X2 [Ischnura elegans]